MPGQSRSLLHFAPNNMKMSYGSSPAPVVSKNVAAKSGIENAAAPNTNSNGGNKNMVAGGVTSTTMAHKAIGGTFSSDHDYFNNIHIKTEEGIAGTDAVDSKKNITMTSYIEEDAPAQGYGPGKVDSSIGNTLEEQRRINVTTRSGAQLGMRTVVLHVPKDIK